MHTQLILLERSGTENLHARQTQLLRTRHTLFRMLYTNVFLWKTFEQACTSLVSAYASAFFEGASAYIVVIRGAHARRRRISAALQTNATHGLAVLRGVQRAPRPCDFEPRRSLCQHLTSQVHHFSFHLSATCSVGDRQVYILYTRVMG